MSKELGRPESERQLQQDQASADVDRPEDRARARRVSNSLLGIPNRDASVQRTPAERVSRRMLEKDNERITSDADAPAVAHAGVSDASGQLPHADRIQQSFGKHDISDVRAEVGGAASDASDQLGASAYTIGDRVGFASSTPDLHTAAHEAAHVVQQRAGVQLKKLDGGRGDEHEQHADAVADQVTRGQSAEPLLDQVANAAPAQAAGTDAAAVQRKPAGAQQAGQSNEPAARHASWDDVSGAADDVTKQEELDIAWIDALPDHLRESIDVSFADSVAAKQVAAEAKPGQQKIDKAYDKEEAQLKADTRTRLTTPKHKATEKEIAADPEYKKEHARLEEERASEKAENVQATRDNHDKAVNAGNPDQTVTRPNAPKVRRLEGKALARTNFMSWAVHVFGSAEAAKTHFLGIQAVTGHPGMWLAALPRARFQAAEAEFKTLHAGYTFPDTDVAHSMRGMHQQRWGVGMLGHALGEAFDFLAVANPNIKIDDNGHGYAYLLSKFGGTDNKRGTGRAMMGIAESDVETVGEQTAAGKTNTAEQTALEEKVKKQFGELVETSKRFQASMAPQMPVLNQARDLYFGQAKLRAEMTKAKASLAHPDALVKERMKGVASPTPADKAQALQSIKAELQATIEDATKEIAESQVKVNDLLQTAFAGWRESMQGDIDVDQAKLDDSAKSRAAMTAAEAELAALDISGADEDALERLSAFAADHKLTTLDKLKRRPKNAAAYKKQLQTELTTRDAATAKSLKSKDDAAHADIAAIEFYLKKLSDPAFVFGKGVEQSDGHYASKYDASKVPLMQLLEQGNVRDDAMPERPGAKDRKEIFNADLVATLAKYGFAPGANYGDTMHFDFIEGYNKAVPGGRSNENMKRSRYSPEGDLPEKSDAKK